jgi:2-oxoglutarate dehydrogenase complex dehydrogenase (E1) component-like enzyme
VAARKVADLDPSFHDLTDADFQESFNVGSFAGGKDTMKLSDLIVALKQTYCGPLAPSICTSPAPKKNAGFNSVSSLAGRVQ